MVVGKGLDPKLAAAAERIESRVREIEAKTSIEIVPVIKARSSHFRKERLAMSALVAFVMLAVSGAQMAWAGYPLWLDPLLAFAVGLLVYAVSALPLGLRLLVPKTWRMAIVEDGAEDAFLEHEIFATKARTGLLLYVSAAEHAVFAVADRGLLEKAGLEVIRGLGEGLARDLSKLGSEGTLLSALDEVEAKLVQLFPPDAQNPNELADHLRR